MLQDTDFFKRFEALSTLGDVHAQVEWEESPSPDERYQVIITWRFRSKRVGEASIVIEPVLGTDEFRLFWVWLSWEEDWRDKGLYSELLKSYVGELPTYGVTSIVASPRDKQAETILASQGFEWVGHEFVADLRAS